MRLSYSGPTFLIRNLARLLFRMKIIDVENIPSKGPFILACNHISYFDPPLVGSSFKREVHFMAKKELFRNRLFGRLISHFNAHPINRDSFDKAAIEMISRVLNSDQGVMIFPEGTRAKKGTFLPPRPGIGMIAISNSIPVVPAYINGANDLWGCFLGRSRLGVIFGQPMDKAELEHYEKDKQGYRRLAEDIMARIKALKMEFFEKTGLSRELN